jgi:XPA protein C-terminus
MKLCTDCRQSEKFKMITATRAKTEHKLNESYLSALKVIHVPNPHYRNSHEMRLYALAEVKRVSEAKMEAKGTTLEEAKRQGEQRGEAVKRRKLEAKESRRL